MDLEEGCARPSQASDGCRVFAWAGVRFERPAGWETGHLGKDHGWLEADFQPVLEFKTAVIRGRFSFRRQLKQLARNSSLRLEPSDLPPTWRPLLKAFHTSGFRWQGPRLGGDGLVIHCPVCRRATLLQFYRTGGAQTQAQLKVLGSFDDHGAARRPSLAVYDIQATVPEHLPLVRFRFESGRFELVFGDRRSQLTLWRWSPADTALRHHGDSLLAFARRNGLPAGAFSSEPGRSFSRGLEWRWPSARRRWRERLPPPFRRRLAPNAFRIWHRQASNRILAARGDGLIDYDIFREVCRSYATVR